MVGKADGVVEGVVWAEGARGGWLGMVVGGVEGVVLRFFGDGAGLGWVWRARGWMGG